MTDLTITRHQLYIYDTCHLFLICTTTLSCGAEFSAVLKPLSQMGKLSPPGGKPLQIRHLTTVWLYVAGRERLQGAKHCPCIGLLNPQQSYEVDPDYTPLFRRRKLRLRVEEAPCSRKQEIWARAGPRRARQPRRESPTGRRVGNLSLATLPFPVVRHRHFCNIPSLDLLPQASADRFWGSSGQGLETCINFATWRYMYLLLVPPEAAVISYPFPIPQNEPPEHHIQAQRGCITSSRLLSTADVVQHFSLALPSPHPASWLSTRACAMLQSNIWRGGQDPQGLAEPGARSSLVPRRAGTEVTGSRISVAHQVSRLPGSAADTGHRMTWGLLGDLKAMPAPHLCPYPRAGVASAEVAASAELTP